MLDKYDRESNLYIDDRDEWSFPYEEEPDNSDYPPDDGEIIVDANGNRIGVVDGEDYSSNGHAVVRWDNTSYGFRSYPAWRFVPHGHHWRVSGT